MQIQTNNNRQYPIWDQSHFLHLFDILASQFFIFYFTFNKNDEAYYSIQFLPIALCKRMIGVIWLRCPMLRWKCIVSLHDFYVYPSHQGAGKVNYTLSPANNKRWALTWRRACPYFPFRIILNTGKKWI